MLRPIYSTLVSTAEPYERLKLDVQPDSASWDRVVACHSYTFTMGNFCSCVFLPQLSMLLFHVCGTDKIIRRNQIPWQRPWERKESWHSHCFRNNSYYQCRCVRLKFKILYKWMDSNAAGCEYMLTADEAMHPALTLYFPCQRSFQRTYFQWFFKPTVQNCCHIHASCV